MRIALKRYQIRRLWILGTIACLGLPGCADQTPVRPNILLILTDDQGWGDVGYHGNEVVQTPNIDRLANQSVRFSRFYVSPVCAPTRASLLTGRYHLATGVTWVTHRKEVMRSEEVTLAEHLKTRGYRTGLFGKWHNGSQFPHDPLGQGFDRFLGFSTGHFNNYFDATLREELNETRPKATSRMCSLMQPLTL